MADLTNRHPLLASSTRVALAAYLHDLGKFAERAAIAEAEVKDGEGNTAKDIHKQEYCPKYKERYSHIHAAYTAIAIDLLEQYLPDIKSGDCSPFASWKDARHLAAGDSIVNAAARHHKPETLLQWIVAYADRLASGFERSEFELYNRAEEGTKERSHVTARMEVLLEKVSLKNSADNSTRVSKYRYRLEPLSPLALMPVPKEECEPEKNDQGRRQYRELWQQFFSALKKVDGREAIPAAHKKDLPLWLDHFDSLWMTFTHCIPSATAARVDGKFIDIPADVSLYDHSKTTAALAAALWRWHASTGRTDGEAARALRQGSEDEQQKFLLVQGDMAGIQEFIFASGGSTQKYAAKLLRGRSFMVSLLAECAALYVLESIGLPPTSQVINAAGKFLIVAPNTADTIARLEAASTVINRWFLHRSQGRAGLALSWLPAAATDFRHGGTKGSPFSQLMRKLFALLDIRKLQRMDICSAEVPAVFENYADAFAGQGECPLDAYSPAQVEHKGKLVSRLAKDQIRIGEYLSRADYNRVLVTRAAVNEDSLTTDFFGYHITFARGEDISGEFAPLAAKGSLLRAWDYSLPEGESDRLWNGYARRSINAFVPVFNEDDAHIPGRYRHVDKDVELDTRAGDIKALDYLAHEDRFPEQGDDGKVKWRGISALHTLKGDVDNLGVIFQQGLTSPTFAKMASLSRQMNAFFSIWLPWRCRENFTNTYTVFAGGDDFFLIGPWKTQMELMQTIRKDLSHYTAGNPDIHFSAGLYLSKPGLPVRHTGELAEEALGKSKRRDGKDAVTCFGQTVDWHVFDQLGEIARQIVDWRREYSLSTGFVYGLLRLVDMAGDEHRQPENALWRSWLAYRVQRHVGDRLKPAGDEDRDKFERRRQRVVETLLGKLTSGIDKYRRAYYIALFLHLYQYRD
ncbi:MAG: type III-A CRISPR-associated protein Cas10/Csm1 [Exilibacterium sp.]